MSFHWRFPTARLFPVRLVTSGVANSLVPLDYRVTGGHILNLIFDELLGERGFEPEDEVLFMKTYFYFSANSF